VILASPGAVEVAIEMYLRGVGRVTRRVDARSVRGGRREGIAQTVEGYADICRGKRECLSA
jgi:hypothetical protein